jgi:Uma2 family endonuclease
MGWLIDPHSKLIFTYSHGSHPQVFELENELISVPNFATNLQITLGEIFSWLQVKVAKVS